MSNFADAKYIKAHQNPPEYSSFDPAPFFRKEFEIGEQDIKNAELFVQSPGFACFYLNGQEVTEDRFISPISDYSKILWYNIYNVTHLLHPGKNTAGVICGNGFFNESFESGWHYPTAPWRDAPQFLLCLKINGTPALVSDASWKTSIEKSHIVYNHLRSGEYVDMRKYDPTWLYIGYDDSHWQNAIEREAPVSGILRPINCQPVRETEEIAPISIEKLRTVILWTSE